MSSPKGTRRLIFLNAILLGVSSLVVLSVFELSLMLLGFPTERGIQTTHPANYRETRKHLEYQYEFETNSLGLRSPEIAADKPAGVRRIFLAGDSFVEGIGVNQDETIAAYLQADLGGNSRLEVINGGLQGTGAFEHGRLVRRVGYGLDLDGLLYFVFDNDVSDARPSQQIEDMERDSPEDRSGIKAVVHFIWPRTYTIAAAAMARLRLLAGRDDVIETIMTEARARGISQERIEQWRAQVLPRYGAAIRAGEIAVPIFSLSLVSPNYWSEVIDLDTARAQQRFEKFIELLEANVTDARERGLAVGVVYIPSKFQFDPDAHSPDEPWILAGADIRENWLTGKSPLRSRLEAWAARNDVPYLDLTPQYREAVAGGQRLTWRLDEHLNATGNRLTAAGIADWLRASGLFDFL